MEVGGTVMGEVGVECGEGERKNGCGGGDGWENK